MLASVDTYLSKRHRGDAYNCLHFAREVWLKHVGDDIGERLKALHEGSAGRRVHKSDVAAFQALREPTDPCIVLFRRPFGAAPHVGVLLRGRVLHLSERGARFERIDLAMFGFVSARFYR